MSEQQTPENEQCPVCGYCCLGKGGMGCIDKPTLCGVGEPTPPAPPAESLNHEDAAETDDYTRGLERKIATLEQERDRLRADQQDWRKGVALIASALGDPADNLSCVRIAEIGLTLRANLETADEQLVRLKEQARSISVRLTDAGIGPMTIPEGVTALMHRAEAAEARCAALTVALEEAISTISGWRKGSIGSLDNVHVGQFHVAQLDRLRAALAAAPQGDKDGQ